MRLAQDYGIFMQIKRRWLYLHVVTVADIITPDGYFLQEVTTSDTPMVRNLQWPQQGKPGDKNWKVWRGFYHTLSNGEGLWLRADLRLDLWISTHLRWQWISNGTTVHDLENNVCYSLVTMHQTRKYERGVRES